MGIKDVLKKIFPCCFADENGSKKKKEAKKEAKKDKAPAAAASTTTAAPTTTTTTSPKSNDAGKGKAKGKEPEHFHDNDDLAARAKVYRDKARKLRDDAHKPENKSNKSQLLEQADAEDAKASKMIFDELQKKQPEGTIDLHLQFVAEAIRICDQQLDIGRKKGWSQMVIIVGKGNHSEGGKCKIAPAVEEWASKKGLQLERGEGKVTVTL